jgi:poly(3-hydroxybutyrate) depolymerase
MPRFRVRAAALAVAFIVCACAAPRAARAATLDLTGAPGNNYDKANFRLWYPDGAGPVRAIVVLVPGSNGDGRPQADEAFWQAFATRHRLALVGCQFTDKQHDQMFIEHYVDVSKGSGQALVDALATFASRSNHAELASAPLLLWGMSAGGEFNYEFVAWKPERVLAFIVNKGNVYYTALASQAARNVPGILFTGEKDLEFRVNTIVGLFAVNRRAGALWAYAEEPGIGHAVGRSRDMAVMLYEDMLAARLPEAGTNSRALRPVPEKAGFFGDMKTRTFEPVKDAKAPTYPVAWLPTERLARAWQAVITGTPFDQ